MLRVLIDKQLDVGSMSTSSTVMDLSGGDFYDDSEEQVTSRLVTATETRIDETRSAINLI